MYYILICSAALLYSIDFTVNKLFQKINGASLKTSLAFNSLLGLFTAIIMFTVNGFKVKITPFSIIMTIFYTLSVMLYNILGFKLLKIGSMARYTLYLMVGGMVVPYIFGLFFLNEPFTIARFIAIILVALGVRFAYIQKGENKTKLRVLFLYIAVFLLNGCTSVISKVHQISTTFEAVTILDFILLSGVCRFIISGTIFLLTKKEDVAKIQIKSVGLIIASATLCSLAFIFQLAGASKLPATVLFPFLTGGTIIFSALCGKLFYKENFTKNSIIGIALCFIGTLLFL